MARKKYADLIQKRVHALRVSRDVMLYLGDDTPNINVLGDVFQRVYLGIEDQDESSIKRAFTECDLSLDNPFHWADLLRVLCDLHFGPKRNEGKKKRTVEFFEQLKEDRLFLAVQGCSGQTAQARKLKEEFPGRYPQAVKTVLRMIQLQDNGK